MKPDDILNAIGEVDEKYIKRAHMKERLKGFLAFSITLIVLLVGTSLLMEPNYILLRMNPDFSVNTGYVDSGCLGEDTWTTLEQTSYKDGKATSSTVFKRALYGNLTINHTDLNGEIKSLMNFMKGEDTQYEFLGEKEIKNMYIQSFFTKDLSGRIDSVAIYSGIAYGVSNQLLNLLKLEYDSGDFLVKQIKIADDISNEIIGYRTFAYENEQLVKTMDYDGNETLLGYIEYTYDGHIRTSRSYTAEGLFIGSTQTQYDWFNRVQYREHFDEVGNLLSKEVYYYRIWDIYRSIEGICTFIIIFCLAATIGVGVYEDRIRLPIREKDYDTFGMK